MMGGPLMAGKRILVVDDETKILELLAEFLESSGFEVDAASSGAKAIRLIAADSYDAVVSDIWMQGVSGADVLKALSEYQPDCEAIVVSAYVTDAMRQKMTALGAYAVMDKPVALAALAKKVGEAVESNRTDRMAASDISDPGEVSLARVLIAGGSESRRDLLSRHLGERGFDIDRAAESGEAGVTAEGFDYSLVLVHLDGGAAIEAVGRITGACPGTMVVGLAKDPDGPEARDALARKAYAVLKDDLSPAEMLAAVTRFIMLSQARMRSSERRRSSRENGPVNGKGSPPGPCQRRALGSVAAIVVAALVVLAVVLGVLSRM